MSDPRTKGDMFVKLATAYRRNKEETRDKFLEHSTQSPKFNFHYKFISQSRNSDNSLRYMLDENDGKPNSVGKSSADSIEDKDKSSQELDVNDWYKVFGKLRPPYTSKRKAISGQKYVNKSCEEVLTFLKQYQGDNGKMNNVLKQEDERPHSPLNVSFGNDWGDDDAIESDDFQFLKGTEETPIPLNVLDMAEKYY